jgi:hypothetical protein
MEETQAAVDSHRQEQKESGEEQTESWRGLAGISLQR